MYSIFHSTSKSKNGKKNNKGKNSLFLYHIMAKYIFLRRGRGCTWKRIHERKICLPPIFFPLYKFFSRLVIGEEKKEFFLSYKHFPFSIVWWKWNEDFISNLDKGEFFFFFPILFFFEKKILNTFSYFILWKNLWEILERLSAKYSFTWHWCTH